MHRAIDYEQFFTFENVNRYNRSRVNAKAAPQAVRHYQTLKSKGIIISTFVEL